MWRKITIRCHELFFFSLLSMIYCSVNYLPILTTTPYFSLSFLIIWNQICLSWSFKVKKLDVKVIYLLQQRYVYFRLPPPPLSQPTTFLPFFSRNTSHPFVRSSSILNCLQFSVSDFWGGPFTLHGWGSQVWRRYSRISQGILITMPLHFVASIYNIIFFLLSEIMDCTDVGHGSLTSFTRCSGDSSATYPLMHS